MSIAQHYSMHVFLPCANTNNHYRTIVVFCVLKCAAAPTNLRDCDGPGSPPESVCNTNDLLQTCVAGVCTCTDPLKIFVLNTSTAGSGECVLRRKCTLNNFLILLYIKSPVLLYYIASMLAECEKHRSGTRICA
jgi:hypothetical protein